MNCINVIPVVKVGLEVEFLSGSTFLSQSKLEPHRDYRRKSGNQRGGKKTKNRDKEKRGRAAPGIRTQRIRASLYIQNAELFNCCRDVAYNFTNIQHYGTREIERERENVCARWYVYILHAKDLVWWVSEWTMNLHERGEISRKPEYPEYVAPFLPPSPSPPPPPVSRHRSGMYTD